MDEKTEIEFFKILVKQNVQLPVLETALINDSVIDSVIHTDGSGLIKFKTQKSLKISNFLQKVLEENEVKSKVLRLSNPKLVYFSKHGKRKVYSELEIKEIIAKKKVPISSNLIQKINISLFSKEAFVAAKVVYLNKKFEVVFSHDNQPINDPILSSQIIDMLSILVSALESSELKRVVNLEVEFLKDNLHSLWLSSCVKCHLIEARHVLKVVPQTEEELYKHCKSIPKFSSQKVIKTKAASRRSSVYSADHSDFSEFYTFQRGQLRNLSSNLNSPIRYIAPEVENEDGNLDDAPYLNFVAESERKCQDSRDMQRTENDSLKNPSTSHKGFYDFPQNDILELSRSFSKEEFIKSNKKMTELPKRSSLLEPPRKSAYAKTPTNMKSLPNLKKTQNYGNYFMELVLNTCCKKDLMNQNKMAEFGLGTLVTCEEFSNFINKANDFSSRQNIKAAARSMINDYFSRNPSPFPDIKNKEVLPKVAVIVKKTKKFVKKSVQNGLKKRKLTPLLSPKNNSNAPLIHIINSG